MAMIYRVRELSVDGIGIGRFRYVGLSDESKSAVDPLCDCDNGHATSDEAKNCPKAKARYDKIFPNYESVQRAKAEETWAYIERLLCDECGLRPDEGLIAQRPNLVNAILQGMR